MGRLVIRREKAFVGGAVKLNCYVNEQMVCQLKNGEEKFCEIDSKEVDFKCNSANSPMSDIYHFDLSTLEEIHITVRLTMWKPKIIIYNKTGEILDIKGESSDQKDFLEKIGIERNAFVPTTAVSNYFAVNEETRQWAVARGIVPSFRKAVPYSYDDIVDYELLEDGTSITKGGLGNAVVGGVLFGSVGAMVGGMTGTRKTSSKCTNLMIKITVNNVSEPVEYIKLISSPTDKRSAAYKKAFFNAQQILSMLQVICSQCTDDVEENKVETSEPSVIDEIRKYKELWDEGIITDEEFRAKKAQLLNL